MNLNTLVQPPVKSGGNKTILWLLLVLVLVGLIIGGGYWYLGKQQITSQPAQPAVNQQANILDNLTNDLNTEEIPTVESDFTEVDIDLQNL